MQNERYYKSSNRADPLGLIALVLVTAVAGSALSILYLLLVRVIPIVQLSILLTILFGGLLGLIGSLTCGIFKLRNRLLTIIASVAGILIYTYVKWSLFSSFALDESYFTLLTGFLTSPTALLEAIALINKYGTWSFGRDSTTAVTGVILAIIWIIEFLIYAIIHLLVVNDKTNTPFIEKENNWAKKSDVRFYCRDFVLNAHLSEIENDPNVLLSYLDDPQVVGVGQHIEIELFHSSDFTENYIDIIRVVITNAARNNKQETKLVKKLAVNREFAQKLFAQHDMSLPA